jgi:hypothetical protein
VPESIASAPDGDTAATMMPPNAKPNTESICCRILLMATAPT